MKAKIIFLGLLIGIILSCSKESDPVKKYSISGLVQKGPFIKGSQIEISELTKALVQTGKTFNSELKNDLGEFELSDLELESTMVEIIADGYYYNEVIGNLSQSRLTLKSLSDISIKESVNVNILTHIIIDRLKTLMEAGESYETAKNQSQQELLGLFQIGSETVSDFENMDISGEGTENGILIALSSILQGNNSVAELSKLLADFKEDFGDNGTIDDANIQLELINNAKSLNTVSVKSKLESYYNSLGLNMNVPAFETHITKFIADVGFEPTLEIRYPVTGDFGDNLLAMVTNSEIISGQEYSATATFPSDIELLLKLKMNKIDGDIAWQTQESEQINWTGIPADGIEIQGVAVGANADMPIVFSGSGKVELQIETFKIGVDEEYLGTKQIVLIIN